jgi:hypothetical protein
MHARVQVAPPYANALLGSLSARAGLAAAALCAALGALAARSPALVGGLVIAALVGGGLLALARRGVSLLALLATVLLGGYVVLTRGFSGLHVPLGGLPLYVGELGLALLLLPALRRLERAWIGPPAILLAMWMAYNGVLTLRDLPVYGIDTLHDAATWYYGLYAIIGAVVWRTLGADGLRRALAPIFVLSPLAGAIALGIGLLPVVQPPFADSSLFTAKTDIIGMHLLGATAFFLTGQHRRAAPWAGRVAPLVVAAAMLYVLVGLNRATFIGLLGLLALLAVYGMWRPILISAATGLLVLGLLAASGVRVSAGGRVADFATVLDREASLLRVSSQDLVDYRTTGADVLNTGSVSWRILWWHALWDDAVGEPRTLLFGRGYGVDLRGVVARYAPSGIIYAGGGQDNEDHPLRSPHNIAMTLLGRSGLVGLALWLLLLGACFGRVLRTTLAARHAGRRDDELLGVWFLAEGVLIVLVALFGVVLEAPHAAIPFFVILGAALAWASDQAAPSKRA